MPPKIECSKPAQTTLGTTIISGKKRNILQCDSCCFETKNALMNAVTSGPALSGQGKTHLTPIVKRINEVALEEYVFMIWGVTEAQRDELYQMVSERFKE